jgi:DNA-binding NtrC family response regulator
VVLLARYFLQIFNKNFYKNITYRSDLAAEMLKLYQWKGNVRELKNMMERGVLTADGPKLTPGDLGLDRVGSTKGGDNELFLDFPPLPGDGIDFAAVKEDIDRFYFNQAMELAGGNESQAARLLKMKHHAFRYQYKKIMEECPPKEI